MRIAATVGAWVVLGLFAAMLVLAFFHPIYTDEVGYHMQASRVFVEGGRLVSLTPQCRASFATPLPISAYPAAALYHLFFSKLGLVGLRIASIVIVIGWFAAAFFVIKRWTKTRDERLRKIAAFVAIHAFGLVPLTIVTARPEPILMLGVGAYCVIPFLGVALDADASRTRRLAIAAGGFVLLTSVFYFSHPKALLFTPLVFLSAALTFPPRKKSLRVALAGVGAFVSLTLFEKYRQASQSVACPESPKLEEALRWLTMNPGDLFRSPGPFLSAGIENLRKHTWELAESMTLEPPFMRSLPFQPEDLAATQQHGALVTIGDALTRVLIYGLVVLVPVSVMAIAAVVMRRSAAKHRMPIALAIAVLVGLGAAVFLSNNWNYYHAPMVIESLAVVAVLIAATVSASPPPPTWLTPQRIQTGAIVLFASASISMIATLIHVGPKLIALAGREGVIVPGQPSAVPIFRYESERTKIRAHASSSCAIDGDHATHLVIDDATLFAFEDLREPYHLIYVTDDNMWGGDVQGEKDVVMLRSIGASGIITRCTYFPTALRGIAKQNGDYCCVGRDAFSAR